MTPSWKDYVRPDFTLKYAYNGTWYPSKEGFCGPTSQILYSTA